MTKFRIAVLTLLCCALPTLAVPAFSSSFNIRHENAYVYMPLPGTLGDKDYGWCQRQTR